MRPLPIALMLTCLLMCRDASADDRQKRAEQLFRDAKAMTDEGQYPPACLKLEQSERLDPALGTEFNLADCYEHTSRPAQAFKLFRAVADAAHVAGKDARERAARARADALEPQISQVRIKFSAGVQPAGARLTLDGRELQDPAASQVLAPGHYMLRVSAPSMTSWSRDVAVAADEKLEVLVPELAKVVDTPPPMPPPPLAPRGSRARIVAYALGGAAVVGLGVGLVAGENSITEHDHAHSVCPHPSPCADAQASAEWTRSTTAGTVSTVFFVSGGALGVAAIIVGILSPASPSSRVSSSCGLPGCSLGLRF